LWEVLLKDVLGNSTRCTDEKESKSENSTVSENRLVTYVLLEVILFFLASENVNFIWLLHFKNESQLRKHFSLDSDAAAGFCEAIDVL
jgi:hypothetical protein